MDLDKSGPRRRTKSKRKKTGGIRSIKESRVDLHGGPHCCGHDRDVVVHGLVTGIPSGGRRVDKRRIERSGIRCRPRSGGERP